MALDITVTEDKPRLTLAPQGEIDTATAPQFEAAIGTLDGITELQLDFSGVEYVSSAGLRVLLKTQKAISKKGTMTLYNVNEAVMEVFEVSGFSGILTIR
ncbi:MAG: STAS domain-containing protein [Coriobacteriia bacterium]|nr:STAS domain-containing protein [Coriobacteriia bacterium]